jgi:hypothetical protein
MWDRRVEKKGDDQINGYLGENGGELVETNKYLCVQKKDPFVGFIHYQNRVLTLFLELWF